MPFRKLILEYIESLNIYNKSLNIYTESISLNICIYIYRNLFDHTAPIRAEQHLLLLARLFPLLTFKTIEGDIFSSLTLLEFNII